MDASSPYFQNVNSYNSVITACSQEGAEETTATQNVITQRSVITACSKGGRGEETETQMPTYNSVISAHAMEEQTARGKPDVVTHSSVITAASEAGSGGPGSVARRDWSHEAVRSVSFPVSKS